ncbi:MAG: translation elongation factor Ts, partial [Clostridia bacterium]|nr:translation elongation factor Ts [Clostridia bacterium]
MAFTAKDVMALREKSGAGMLECKKALTDADGDMEKAAELLRERGIAKAVKKEGRIAAEGAVGAYVCDKCGVGVLLEINCESDFVSRGDKFHEIVDSVAKVVAENKPADVEALNGCKLGNGTVKDYITNQTAVIGEKISIRRFAIYETKGKIETYIHMGGKVGVMVEAVDFKSGAEETLHDIALQIAASKPSYVTSAEVPAEVLEKEKEIMLVQMQNDEKNKNKPKEILEKIVAGKMGKFYQENCLLEQAFVKDDTQKVSAVIGSKFSVVRFARFEMGEGIEKKSENLQDEVAKQI